MASRKPRPILRVEPTRTATATESEPEGLLGDAEPEAAAIGELFRRVALGLASALMVARAYWPAEYRAEGDTGSGLLWALLMLAAASLAVMGMWLEGGLRLRRSWADLGVIVLFGLVALSAAGAAERRIAVNVAWEWAGVGVGYFLLRNLPRTRGETSALAGAFAATAVAVAAYGLYQAAVELPRDRVAFQKNPRVVAEQQGIDPGDPAQMARFRDRLMGSREPLATFALTNTLAGFLVGPTAIVLVMALRGVGRPDSRRAALIAAPLGLCLLVCLLLTKSRSGYLGLLAAMLGLAWLERGRVSFRRIVIAGAGLLAIAAALVTAGAMAGQLDRQVITESFKSLSYRAEYWRGAWGVITEDSRRMFRGVGPGNFAGPYLKHKLPRSSEEIADPHNFVLDVWATAGVFAVAAMLLAIGFGLRACFGRPTRDPAEPPPSPREEPDAPRGAAWLLIAAGLGAWLLAVALGKLNPFEGDPTGRRLYLGISARWVILVVAWGLAVVLGRPLWRRSPITADAIGLGVVAIVVNLLAAGGIGFAPVALMLWGLLALGQDLREDRGEGVRRAVGARVFAFAPAAVLAAVVGTFVGTVAPFWRAEAEMTMAEDLLKRTPPEPAEAAAHYMTATRTDPLSARPWIGRANVEYQQWRRQAARTSMSFTWLAIDSALKSALKPPRNPDSLLVHRLRARWARDFLADSATAPTEMYRIRIDRLDSCRRACEIYPTDATLRADLAEALGDLDKYDEAIVQGKKARELDEATPHADKKMSQAVRTRLNLLMPRWRAALDRRTPRSQPPKAASSPSRPSS